MNTYSQWQEMGCQVATIPSRSKTWAATYVEAKVAFSFNEFFPGNAQVVDPASRLRPGPGSLIKVTNKRSTRSKRFYHTLRKPMSSYRMQTKLTNFWMQLKQSNLFAQSTDERQRKTETQRQNLALVA